jgi:hypothetical protein
MELIIKSKEYLMNDNYFFSFVSIHTVHCFCVQLLHIELINIKIYINIKYYRILHLL